MHTQRTVVKANGEVIDLRKLYEVGPSPSYYFPLPKEWVDMFTDETGNGRWVAWELREQEIVIRPLNQEEVKLASEN